MRTVQWKVVLTNNNRIASIENAIGLPLENVESHLIIVGILENLKQKHLDKLNSLYEKTIKNRKEDEDEFGI